MGSLHMLTLLVPMRRSSNNIWKKRLSVGLFFVAFKKDVIKNASDAKQGRKQSLTHREGKVNSDIEEGQPRGGKRGGGAGRHEQCCVLIESQSAKQRCRYSYCLAAIFASRFYFHHKKSSKVEQCMARESLFEWEEKPPPPLSVRKEEEQL